MNGFQADRLLPAEAGGFIHGLRGQGPGGCAGHVVGSYSEGNRPETNGATGLASLTIVRAAIDSARTGKPVNIEI